MDKFPLFFKMKQLFYIPIEVPIDGFFKKTKIDWQLVTIIPNTAKLFYSSKSGCEPSWWGAWNTGKYKSHCFYTPVESENCYQKGDI